VSIVTVKYMEILEKQLEKAIEIDRQMYRDEKVVLGSDDLTANEIQAIRNEFATEFEQI